MKRCILIGLMLLPALVYATHNRAGEITYRQISDYTYEITIITYTATGPNWTADRPKLEVAWGDNTTSILPRVEEIFLPDYYKRNKYIGQHTFPGPGIYSIVVEDPNRNLNVSNIPNSVNTVFCISTTMIINPNIGFNNTPVLTQPPVDKATVGQMFIHNPGAYDPDGDSISYKLTTCRAENGEPIPDYTLPPASNSLSINELTGDLVWDAPMYAGVYNVAILIEEWRNNIKIGEIIRDMQIEVFNSDNKPPEIAVDKEVCVEAGTLLRMAVTATDANGDSLVLTATGAPFFASDTIAVFRQTVDMPGHAEGVFTWKTSCELVRHRPYPLNIKAEDKHPPTHLADIENVNITIVGPKVENLQIDKSVAEITINWDAYRCRNISGYNIYRRIQPAGFVPDTCEVGVPPETGYLLVAFNLGRGNVAYVDDNVAQGHLYCYLVTAVFPDGCEGYASDEVCTTLQRGLPVITNVSVENTDNHNGNIYVAWAKPTETDIGTAAGPYQYVVYRSVKGQNDFHNVFTTNNIDDTTFVDNGLNTRDSAYSYKVEFYNNAPDNHFLIGTPDKASSVFLSLTNNENNIIVAPQQSVPWLNSTYTVFRHNDSNDVFDTIATAAANRNYIDASLDNGREYCYYVETKGSYSTGGLIDPILNKSQISCHTAVDSKPPCPPTITVNSLCDSLCNLIEWEYNDTCNNDVKEYRLYYSPYVDHEPTLLTSCNGQTFAYQHFPETSLAACYYMTAVDSFANESGLSNKICIDNCSYYELPNAFSPNGDGVNDLFQPKMPYYFVKKVDMRIYNRWGQIMFVTEDPDINWDGRNRQTGALVYDGVYYYGCDVYEQRLTGVEIRHTSGFIHVYTRKSKNIKNRN